MIPPTPLQSLGPPWVHLFIQERSLAKEPPPNLPGFQVVCLDGQRCRTKETLLREYARSFDFPPYFGRNWDAFEECLSDLDWLPAAGYLTLIHQAESLLNRQEDEYAAFIEILRDIGEGWSTASQSSAPFTPRPFHTVLLVEQARVSDRHQWKIPLLPPLPL